MNFGLFSGVGIPSDYEYFEWKSNGLWVPPDLQASYHVIGHIIGGGGGGASGGVNADADTSARAEGGGGGGAGQIHFIDQLILPVTSFLVVIGSGGAQGAGRSQTAGAGSRTSGLDGTDGGSTSFGFINATGGVAGDGGVTSSAGPATGSVNPALPSIFVNGVVADAAALAYWKLGVAGAVLANSTASNGGGGTTPYYNASLQSGTAGVETLDANGTSTAATAPNSVHYGAGGNGSGGVCSRSTTASRTLTSGDGSAGVQGIARLWIKRIR